ncbi:MAG: hypothetical protein M3N95_12605, partial [Actinomycetota bacterium]|nr:hypothetical protein [Actinomycetota bacterium]
ATQWFPCGARIAGVAVPTGLGSVCQAVALLCAPVAPTVSAPPTTGATVTTPPGGTPTMAVNCNVPPATPQITPAMVAQEVQRLVPHPQVGIAPPGGITLVNIQTLLWVDTPGDLSLGTITLVGQRVQLRVHVARVDWSFGDGSSASATSPGRKYDAATPCITPTCPDYWGHVYSSPGSMTVTAQVTWSGEFRIAAGAWQLIAGTVTGPTQSTTLAVRQARGVLVPDTAGG